MKILAGVSIVAGVLALGVLLPEAIRAYTELVLMSASYIESLGL